jgi:hypothetical protein
MPRYYFDLDEDVDKDGLDLPSDSIAVGEAVDAFSAMIREHYMLPDCEMRVTDAAGRRVISLRFLAER